MNNSTCLSDNTVDLRNSMRLYSYIFLPYEWIFHTIVWPLMLIFGIISNTTFISTVIRISSFHTATFLYLVSLACSDLLTLMTLGSYIILSYATSKIRDFGSFDRGYIIHAIVPVIYVICFMLSTLLVTLVSVERYLAICHPIKHHILKSNKRSTKLIAVVFIVSIICGATSIGIFNADTSICVIWPENEKFINYPTVIAISSDTINAMAPEEGLRPNYHKISQICYSLYFLILLLGNCYLYVRILGALNERRHNSALQTSAEMERNLHQMATMVVANGSVYLMCCTVLAFDRAITVLSYYNKTLMNDKQRNIWQNISHFVVGFNSSINPLIYILTNQRYRHALKSTICRFCAPLEEAN